MRGACFRSVGEVEVVSLPDASLESADDVIVKVHTAGLCGSDLHPFFGREKGLDGGTVMGHEFVGEVVEVGRKANAFSVGDRVMAPFTTNCGTCFYCAAGLTSRCERGQLFGWRQHGRGLHGGQAEYVRVPLADATLMQVPAGMTDETALLLGDNLSTGHFAAEMAGCTHGGTYAVIGCGTVGLLAITAALDQGADTVVAVDPNPSRVTVAETLGAIATTDPDEALEKIGESTDGRGAEGVMELVGLPEAQALAYRLVRPGGVLSVIGCHCTPHFAFSPSDAYDKNLTYRTGRCPARHSMSKLADAPSVTSRDYAWCITHRFSLDEAVQAYDTFAHGKDGCVKAVLTFG